MDLTRDDDGKVFLARSAHSNQGAVGGEVYENFLADPAAEPDDESAIDEYNIVFDVGFTGRDRNTQMAEAESLFLDLTSKLPWPALLVGGVDLLLAAWSQELGLHLYPESATVDATDRPKWEAYR
jgi:hypothetical protein